MINLLKIHFYKLRTSKTFYFISAYMILQSILFFTMRFEKTGKAALKYSFEIQEMLLLTILIGILGAYYIVEEFDSGYIKSLISYGHKRETIFISKCIVFYLGVVIISLIFPIIITITTTIIYGYGEKFTLSSFEYIARTVFLMLLIYIGIGSISALITFIFRNSTISSCVFILIDVINRVVLATVTNKKQLNILREIYEKTIFSQSQFVCLNGKTSSINIQVISISLLTILISTSIGIYFFKRKDI